jgi:hypothetical protein
MEEIISQIIEGLKGSIFIIIITFLIIGLIDN